MVHVGIERVERGLCQWQRRLCGCRILWQDGLEVSCDSDLVSTFIITILLVRDHSPKYGNRFGYAYSLSNDPEWQTQTNKMCQVNRSLCHVNLFPRPSGNKIKKSRLMLRSLLKRDQLCTSVIHMYHPSLRRRVLSQHR